MVVAAWPLFAMAVLSGAGQGRADLSGTWLLDPAKTVTTGPAAGRGSSVPLTIRQTPATVEMTRLQRTVVYRFAGKASAVSEAPPEIAASFDGTRLTITTAGADGAKTVAHWYLEGQFLVNDVESPTGKTKQYFRRQ
jgi:hypothetical protein